MSEPIPIPKTQKEILAWLEGLLSKQYDTEETALHAIEEYRDLVAGELYAEHERCSDLVPSAGCAETTAALSALSVSFRLFAERIGGAARPLRPRDTKAVELARNQRRIAELRRSVVAAERAVRSRESDLDHARFDLATAVAERDRLAAEVERLSKETP